jgi:uncharacterized protein YchJ
MSSNIQPISLESTVPEQIQSWQEEARSAVPKATQTIIEILNDPTVSPSLRLRAAGMILKMADLKSAPSSPCEKAVKSEIVHNPAQSMILPFRRESPKIGRNEPCPCGSGRKYKMCCIDHFAKLRQE